jgi:GTPase SAR1 family protein
MSRAKINFIKLTTEELSNKIALLVSNHDRVIFWKTSPRYFEGFAGKFLVQNRIFLTLEKTDTTIRLNGESICLNFTLNDIDYFLRGKIIEQPDEEARITVELEEECFRMEKRSRERLLTYPVYDVYAYIKFQKKPKPNVIFFNKGEQKTRDFFSEIDNIQKNKISAMSEILTAGDEEDLIGFRVEDLSSNGLSFFASAKEKELVLDEIEENFSLVLNFEMQIFNLEEAVIVYKMNYINSQFQGVPMYKVGINFKHSPSLKRKIEDVSGITVDLVNYQKEFEEFIKNE